MIRMELDISILIRVLVLSSGYIIALFRLYRLKVDNRLIISGVIVLLTIYLMTQSTYYIVIKLVVYFLVSFMIVSVFYKVPYMQATMFSHVLLFMVSFSDMVSLQIMAQSEHLLDAVVLQEDSFHGILGVLVPSVTVFLFYVSGAEILRRVLDVYRERLGHIYVISSLGSMLSIYMVALLISYALENMTMGLTLKEIYNLVSFAYIGIFFLPIMVLYILRKVYLFDLEYERLEKEMNDVNDLRINAHRYSHNLNNIILSIHQLSKENNEEGIIEYLDKL